MNDWHIKIKSTSCPYRELLSFTHSKLKKDIIRCCIINKKCSYNECPFVLRLIVDVKPILITEENDINEVENEKKTKTSV